jgi:23S rRNA (guanosine2251-2'-O)-methyltransferase
MARSSREYIYGINPAFECLRAGRRTLFEAFLSQSSERNPRLRKLERLFQEHQIQVNWVEKGRIMDLSGSKDNQGVVIKVSPYPYIPLSDMLDQDRLLLLDNVEDPHNVGAILRSAEVFGFHHVLLTTKGTPEIYPSVVKVSAGATEFLAICREKSATHYTQAFIEHGYEIVALDAKGTTPLESLRHAGLRRLALVVGGEDRSVGQYILNHAAYIASIPQKGRINSLNASIAAALAMHTLAL